MPAAIQTAATARARPLVTRGTQSRSIPKSIIRPKVARGKRRAWPRDNCRASSTAGSEVIGAAAAAVAPEPVVHAHRRGCAGVDRLLEDGVDILDVEEDRDGSSADLLRRPRIGLRERIREHQDRVADPDLGVRDLPVGPEHARELGRAERALVELDRLRPVVDGERRRQGVVALWNRLNSHSPPSEGREHPDRSSRFAGPQAGFSAGAGARPARPRTAPPRTPTTRSAEARTRRSRRGGRPRRPRRPEPRTRSTASIGTGDTRRRRSDHYRPPFAFLHPSNEGTFP